MKLNNKILLNLESLFKKNFREVSHFSIDHWLNVLKAENPDAYNINQNKIEKLIDESTLENFELAKKNAKLVQYFNNAVEFSFNETEIIYRFTIDLINSFKEIEKELNTEPGSKIQIITLTYDYAPYAWLSGFGEGNYPVLKEPEYFNYNYHKDFFEMVGKVDYSFVWDDLIKLEESLEEADIYDDIFETDFYQNIRNCFIYKTYILLNKAFKQIESEIFKDLDIKKPLFIYGNEHDCEYMNIYCYE